MAMTTALPRIDNDAISNFDSHSEIIRLLLQKLGRAQAFLAPAWRGQSGSKKERFETSMRLLAKNQA